MRITPIIALVVMISALCVTPVRGMSYDSTQKVSRMNVAANNTMGDEMFQITRDDDEDTMITFGIYKIFELDSQNETIEEDGHNCQFNKTAVTCSMGEEVEYEAVGVDDDGNATVLVSKRITRECDLSACNSDGTVLKIYTDVYCSEGYICQPNCDMNDTEMYQSPVSNGTVKWSMRLENWTFHEDAVNLKLIFKILGRTDKDGDMGGAFKKDSEAYNSVERNSSCSEMRNKTEWNKMDRSGSEFGFDRDGFRNKTYGENDEEKDGGRNEGMNGNDGQDGEQGNNGGGGGKNDRRRRRNSDMNGGGGKDGNESENSQDSDNNGGGGKDGNESENGGKNDDNENHGNDGNEMEWKESDGEKGDRSGFGKCRNGKFTGPGDRPDDQEQFSFGSGKDNDDDENEDDEDSGPVFRMMGMAMTDNDTICEEGSGFQGPNSEEMDNMDGLVSIVVQRFEDYVEYDPSVDMDSDGGEGNSAISPGTALSVIIFTALLQLLFVYV